MEEDEEEEEEDEEGAFMMVEGGGVTVVVVVGEWQKGEARAGIRLSDLESDVWDLKSRLLLWGGEEGVTDSDVW